MARQTSLTENAVVAQTVQDYLHDELGWDTINLFDGTGTVAPDDPRLARASEREVVLRGPLRAALRRLNPGLDAEAYDSAEKKLVGYSASQSPLQINRTKHDLVRDGVPVTVKTERGSRQKRLKVIDFSDPASNDFLAVREMWIQGDVYRRRPDLIGFVNGLPLVFMEFKRPSHALRAAYDDNLSDYRDTIPPLFHHNALAILCNGTDARVGAFSSPYRFFRPWKRLSEQEEGRVQAEVLLRGTCARDVLLRLVEHFILFDDSQGTPAKILAQNQQYLGVMRAFEAVSQRKEREGKLGVFWHTQGAGKSYSMVFLTRMVHRALGGQFTFLVCTDREDLDRQIYDTFAGCGLANHERDPCRARSGQHLRQLLGERKQFVFSLIQKFHERPEAPYTERDDVIVLTDEAHRTQHGTLAQNMRDALPGAAYMGFTGTPLFKNDEVTRRIFGDYVSTYDFQRAVQDNATLPLYYDARGEKLEVTRTDLNERIAEVIEEAEIEDQDTVENIERKLRGDYAVVTNPKRLARIADDFVRHYAARWQSGKAMLVCLDKRTCVKMHNHITERWDAHLRHLKAELSQATDEQDELMRRRQIAWMEETKAAVVVSEEQGEVAKFRAWGLDIVPHRKLLKEGFVMEEDTVGATSDGSTRRVDVETAFKDAEHPFRIAIVCAMWLTGFDVPALSTLYLDKPLKAHTLMQAIARANRVHKGKENGLIVDYCGILKNLRKALATYAGHEGGEPLGGDTPAPEVDPVQPAEEELLAKLEEAITEVRVLLAKGDVDLDAIARLDGFERLAVIQRAKEVVNETDTSRKRFGILARAVFRRYKSCFAVDGLEAYHDARDAIDLLYGSLEQDVQDADVSAIVQQLYDVVGTSIDPASSEGRDPGKPYDISQIDFERLRTEFDKSPAKNTTVQSLKHVVEQRLQRMMEQNPTRTDFQARYEEIVEDYNREKDRVTIEQTFEELLKLTQDLDDEEHRAVREGLDGDDEALALFDLLRKDDLSKDDIQRIKDVAVSLLETIKAELRKIEDWRAKDKTRNRVRRTIHDFLFSDDTGLPVGSYDLDEVESKTETVFLHVLSRYDSADPDVYAQAA